MSTWLETPDGSVSPVRGMTEPLPATVRSARVAIGLLTQTGRALDRATGGSGIIPSSVDAAIGVSATAWTSVTNVVTVMTTVARPIVTPVVSLIAEPPFVPQQLQPKRVFEEMAWRGRSQRELFDRELDYTSRALTPVITHAVMSRIDVTDIVIERVDLRRVIETALDTIDLTELVKQRVDIDALVADVDMDAIINRVPIVEIANYVVDEIDLPKIVRESTGGMASEFVRGVRIQSYTADETVSRGIDRVIRRKRRKTIVEGYVPPVERERRKGLLNAFKQDMNEEDA